MKKTLIVSSIIALAFIGSVSAAPPARTAPPQKEAASKCFYANQVSGFKSVDDQSIIISDYHHNDFLVTVSGYCPNLDSSFQIAVVAKGGVNRVCGGYDADLVVSGMGANDRQVCTITDVKPLTKEESQSYTSRRGQDDAKNPTQHAH